MVLLSNRHFCVSRISKIFDTREAAVRRWIERFEQEGIDSLCDRPRSGRPPKVAAAMLPVIERDVLSSPESHGYLFTI
jgi:transposase